MSQTGESTHQQPAFEAEDSASFPMKPQGFRSVCWHARLLRALGSPEGVRPWVELRREDKNCTWFCLCSLLPKVCTGGEAAPFLLQIRSEPGKRRTQLRKKRLQGTGGMKAKEDRNQGERKRHVPEGAGEEGKGGWME